MRLALSPRRAALAGAVALAALAVAGLLAYRAGGRGGFLHDPVGIFYAAEGPPASSAGFAAVNRAVGCLSTRGAAGKDALFARRYRGRAMRWTGTIVFVRAEEIGLRLRPLSDGFELRARLADPKAAFSLNPGDRVALRFVLQTRGDCGTPFAGDDAGVSGQ